MWKWLLLACCVFAGVNWFLLPNYPNLGMKPLTIFSAVGLSGLVMVLGLLFGKHK